MTKIGKWIIDASHCRLRVFAKSYETLVAHLFKRTQIKLRRALNKLKNIASAD